MSKPAFSNQPPEAGVAFVDARRTKEITTLSPRQQDRLEAAGRFPRAIKLKRGETVVFSWIVYKSRADRDRVMAKVMKDKRIAAMMQGKNMPFDGKRMIFGGFRLMVTA